MKAPINPEWFSRVCVALMTTSARTATKYLSDKLVVRATWRHKPSSRNTREELVLTFGVPNYLEKAFIEKCKAAGEPFPVRKIQFKAYPVKKKVSK